MASSIDATKPAANKAYTANVRQNFAYAKAEIEALQAVDDALNILIAAHVTDLASTANGKGAALLGVEDAGSLYIAATVEAALAEVMGDLNTHEVATNPHTDSASITTLASTANGDGASGIGVEDAGAKYVGTTVEAVLQEFLSMALQAANNVNISGGVIAGITDLAVADGGTGKSSVTANRLLLGNGSAALSESGYTMPAADGGVDQVLTRSSAGVVTFEEPQNAPFRGALVYRTATHATGIIAWDNENYDTDTIHDNATNNSRLTVPTGVTRVRISFGIKGTGTSQGEVYKNGSAVLGGGQGASANNAGDQLLGGGIGAVLTVIAGDYFELNVALVGLAASSVNNWFAMEIIE